MKLKINKACDLSSISVLPPQTRRCSASFSGFDSSSSFERSQTASQLRPQQPLQSQPTLSQGVSSQTGLLSQFSQNSQDEILTNEKIGSQERDVSARRTSLLPPISYAREESHMMVSRGSNNLMRKLSGHEYKCQMSEELEHRIGMIETSLSRLGIVLDSVQSDIMQVNRGTKEIALEMEGVRQKLIVVDDSMQSMVTVWLPDLSLYFLDVPASQRPIPYLVLSQQNMIKQMKGQETIRTQLDVELKSLSDQLKAIASSGNLGEIISMLSALPDKIDNQILKFQNYFRRELHEEIQASLDKANLGSPEEDALSRNLKFPKQKKESPPVQRPKAIPRISPPKSVRIPNKGMVKPSRNSATGHLVGQHGSVPKVEVGGWTSVKQQELTCKVGSLGKGSNRKKSPRIQMENRILVESDEEIDGGFSCLLKVKETEIDEYSIEEAKEETARILRKARRRKRKYCNTIIIN